MSKKSKNGTRKQVAGGLDSGVERRVGQMLLPMVAGIAATKADLTSWVQDQGMEALHLLLGWDVEDLVGKKGKHREGRTKGELSFGGRRVQLWRPRVRLVDGGGEAALPSFEAFQLEDPLPARVINQILVGVSTRGMNRAWSDRSSE